MKTNTHQPSRTRKLITYGVIAAMIHAPLAPAIAATGAQHQYEQAQQAQQQSTDDAVSQMMELAAKHTLNIDVIKETESNRLANRSVMTKMVDGVKHVFMDSPEEKAIHSQNNTAVDAVLALETQMHEEHAVLLQQLNQQIQQDKSNNLSDSVAEQQQLLDELNKRYQTLTGLINNLKTADGDAAKNNALAALNTQLTDWQPKKPSIDRNTLPWGTPKNEVRKPIVKDTPTINKVSYQQTGSTAIGQWRDTEYKVANQLLNNNPIKKVAAGGLSGMTTAGNWTVLKALPAKVQPEDLTETDDIQINEEIKKLAKELDHSPAKIYKWVYDNIEFVPTYGSIQGSAFTLETKRGNATDTASLLIALLRASNIPARYVYGTVDVPAKFAMNWVGGVNNLDAAGNLIGQGGIPHSIVMSGSVPKYLRLEHVWVEANISYIPARGSLSADKTTNQPKQWVPMDASYKSYQFSQPIDLKEELNLNDEEFLALAQDGANINSENFNLSNINQSNIDTKVEEYATKIKNYLSQNYPNQPIKDVLAKKQIEPWGNDNLAPILPYKVQTVISDYQVLPDNMRHYFSLKLYPNVGLYGHVDYSSPIMDYKIATVKLKGKPFSLSFKPATPADENTLKSYLPENDENSLNEISQLPRKLPSKISVVPELVLDKEILASAGNYKLGDRVKARIGFISPNSSRIPVNKEFIAGEYHAIGYNLQGISEKQKSRLNSDMFAVKKAIESNDKDKINALTKHDIVGSILQTVVQTYFFYNDDVNTIAQAQAGIVQYPYMSFGTFASNFTPIDRFGLPYAVKANGYIMDIDTISNITVNKNNDQSKSIAYLLAQGNEQSANEHRIPEWFFNTKEEPDSVKAVSAMKALDIAREQGQKIYMFDKSVQNKVLPNINHDSDTMQDIRNALNAGKIVTVSEKPISFNGWNGSGYLLQDYRSGSGAYMISGGLNGGASTAKDGGKDVVLAGVAGVSAITALTPKKVTVSFFGKLKCNFEKNKSILAIIFAVLAIAVVARSVVEMLKYPSLVPIAVQSMKAIMVSAFAMFGTTAVNAGGFKQHKKKTKLDDCVCLSGIKGEVGNCWICSRDSYFPITNEKEVAENIANSLGGCKGQKSANYKYQDLFKRWAAYSRLGNARDVVNRCFFPPHEPHLEQARNAHGVANHCLSKMSKTYE